MPRITRRPLVTSEIATPSLTAATTPITTHTTTRPTSGTDAWKTQAWDAYDTIGELRYICAWIANALSRVTLYAADIDPATGKPTSNPTRHHDAQTITHDIAGGPAGQAVMLSRLATFLTVPGEGWIAIITRDTMEEWHVLADTEIQHRAGTITLHLQDGTNHTFNPDTDILTRIHRPHPRNARESDSPVRAALPILHEIQRMTATIEGAAKSRLAGNGLLLIPSEISMPTTPPPQPDPDTPGLTPPDTPGLTDHPVTATDVMQQLQHVMTTAITDPTSAASMVPIVLKAPADTLDKISHLRFESDITDNALKTRDTAIKRLAISLDVPAEILTGVAQANHWSAWAIDEASIKTHIAPLMTIICDALTDAILRPLLANHTSIDPDTVTIWYDLTGLALHPNRAEDAIAAFDRGAIGADTLRRELGFTDTDAPADHLTDYDLRQLAIELVKAAPSLTPYLADTIGIPIPTTPPTKTPTVPTRAPHTPTQPTPTQQ